MNGASTQVYPQFHPHPSLDTPVFESHGVKEFFLSRDHLGEVFVRVQIKRGLNPRMTQDALHSLRVLNLRCSPAQIIDEFKLSHYLQAIALTICWGTMTRTKNKYIYRSHDLQHIFDTLDQCAQSIKQTSSIQQSWDLLPNGLSWTPVMTSKTLHFLCRALGFEQDPPVPIDNAVILAYVWPGFRINIPPGQRPQDWSGKTFAAYCRYMTAILEWADIKGWSTTELESTIFAENR